MAAFLFMACSQEEETEREYEPVPLKVLINQSQSTDTRATLSGLSTEFEAGDTIGIFVENEDYTQYYNVPYVFDGSNWNLASGEYTPKRVSFLSNYHYYAYYPYTKSLPGWPYYNDSDEDGTCTADDFFENVIDGWTPRADQSTKANFDASDLMVGEGTILSATTGTVSFTLNHKMGLVRITIIDSNDGPIDDISGYYSPDLFPASGNPYIPYNNGKYFYSIVPPGREVPFFFDGSRRPDDNPEEEITAADAGHVTDIFFTNYRF